MKTIALKKPSFSAVADNRVFLIRSLWMALHSFLLIGFIGYQFVQPLFLNATTWIWAYLCLFLCFVSDFMFFYSQGFKVFGLETVDDQKSFFKNASVEWPVGRFFFFVAIRAFMALCGCGPYDFMFEHGFASTFFCIVVCVYLKHF